MAARAGRSGKKHAARISQRSLGIIKAKEIKNMQMNHSRKVSSFILCMMLIVAMAFTTTGCNGAEAKEEPSKAGAEANGWKRYAVRWRSGPNPTGWISESVWNCPP